MTTTLSKINVLDPSVVEKIAAGEVVERPASVLKELVENSIDAGAARVDVAFEDAGFSMMRVSDNGCGMSAADLERCVLPHATSKIKSADDLYLIATMGFRGEALASVSAVSRMNVVTCDGESGGVGCEITVEGGVKSQVAPAARTRGTTITVRDLFYNVPARKKFMKTRRGEHAAIVKVIEQIAIPFPGIHFTLAADGRKLLDLPPVKTVAERICAAAGTEFGRGLVKCEGEGDGMSAVIFVSSPRTPQSKPRFQSLYVNLRRIDNDSVIYAVREAFSQYLGHGNRPAFFCFLDVDPQKVDVNVHPTKQQMKFDDERGVFSFIYRVVREGLRESENVQREFVRGGGGDVNNNYDDDGRALNVNNINNISDNNIGAYADNFSNNLRDNFSSAGSHRHYHGSYHANNDSDNHMSNQHAHAANADDDIAQNLFGRVKTFDGDAPAQDGADEARTWELIQCYQIHAIFILAPIKNGILLIDQHAADERVHYEQALRDLTEGRAASQQLLIPVVFEMSPAEKAVIESGGEYFRNMGFDIADFGGGAISVSALPAFLKYGQAEEAVRDMARYLLDGKNPGMASEPVKRFAAAFACGAAIKAGQKLSQEEMNALINALFSTENPYTCPHGRPTLVRISVEELTRRFLR